MAHWLLWLWVFAFLGACVVERHQRGRDGRELAASARLPRPPRADVQGWYPDPLGRHGSRFHDGIRWTGIAVTIDGRTVVDPLDRA